MSKTSEERRQGYRQLQEALSERFTNGLVLGSYTVAQVILKMADGEGSADLKLRRIIRYCQTAKAPSEELREQIGDRAQEYVDSHPDTDAEKEGSQDEV